MDPAPPRARRRSVVLASNVLAVALLFCCNTCGTSTHTPTPIAHITLCAVDPAYARNTANAADPRTAYCAPGDFQAVNGQQIVRAQAFDKQGNVISNAKLSLTISGANATTTSVTASGGVAEFTYIGSHAGDDSITASFADGTSTAPVAPAVVRWLNPGTYIHPIIVVHGIDEDASDYETQINNAFADSESNTRYPEADDKSEQVFSAPIAALKLKYDPTYMAAFCYLDDQAWINTPSGCPSAETQACTSQTTCVSQSSVDLNGVELARVVSALSAQAASAIGPGHPGTAKVTILAYSMGAAVTRAMLSGCAGAQAYASDALASMGLSTTDVANCGSAASNVDTVFFTDGAQQGAWLLEANKYLNAASLFELNLPLGGGPFPPILPTIQKTIYAKFQEASSGLVATDPAEVDLTPGSPSVVAHDTAPFPNNVDIYNFYSDVQLKLGFTVGGVYRLGGKTPLDLGDLLMLAQDDPAGFPPTWGGAGLCNGCPSAKDILNSVPAVAPYRTGGTLSGGQPQFHAWILMDSHSLDINVLAPNLAVADAKSAFGEVTSSPVWHLQTPQPVTMAPGSAIQVQDYTHTTDHTDVPTEMLYVMAHKDGLTLP